MLLVLAFGCRKHVPDEDFDGTPADLDCDDADPAAHPGATEVCDGIDNDCNELADDAAGAPTWYGDQDRDGVSGTTDLVVSCVAPTGYQSAVDALDCDDADASALPGADERCDGVDNDCDGDIDEEPTDAPTWYADLDGDGDAGEAWVSVSCEAPPGYLDVATDCDDLDATSYPGGEELCDGVDNDCDGELDEDSGDLSTFYADADEDGHGDPDVTQQACEAPPGYVPLIAAPGDCDDGDATVHPGAAETCDDDDDDCDGTVDDNAADATLWYADVDRDGFGGDRVTAVACTAPANYLATPDDCDDLRPAAHPGAVEVCDGRDDDCNGTVDDSPTDATLWYADTDGDGFGDKASTQASCVAPAGYVALGTDCDDTDASAYPAGPELCDGKDDDCDGLVDDSPTNATTWYADLDRDGHGGDLVTKQACKAPANHLAAATDCDDLRANTNPAAPELCDTLDNDCDGTPDDSPTDAKTYYEDTDADKYGNSTVSKVGCAAPAGFVSAGSDCNDGNKLVNPGALERCNSVDDDCDGLVDEADAIDVTVWYDDDDADSYGDAKDTKLACTRPTGFVNNDLDCDDADALEQPGLAERCDLKDNDCNGVVDDDKAVLGDDIACTALDCKDMMATRPGLANGDFWVEPVLGKAFEVECDFTTSGGGWMVFHHDSEAKYSVVGFEAPTHVRVVNYLVADATISATMAPRAEARQSVLKDCYGSGIWSGTSASSYTYWQNVAGTNQYAYWPGGTANCDINDYVWRVNGGDITAKPDLPIKRVFTGDTGDNPPQEQAFITIGPLRVR